MYFMYLIYLTTGSSYYFLNYVVSKKISFAINLRHKFLCLSKCFNCVVQPSILSTHLSTRKYGIDDQWSELWPTRDLAGSDIFYNEVK